MAVISILDLPALEELTQEELEAIFGAGRLGYYRFGIESLEERRLMTASPQDLLLPPVIPTTALVASLSPITIATVNHAPTVKSAAVLNMPGVVSVTGNSSTMSVADLLKSGTSGAISDLDAGAKSGIAVTAVGTSGGTWQYSIDGGKTWNGLTAGTKTARLLTADNDSLLRFTPTVGFAGTIAAGLTVRGWDQTSGVNGGIADVSKAGGNTAFSSAAAAVKVVVTANRAPTVAASAVLNMPGVVSVTGNSSTMSVADLLKSGTSGAISDLDAGAKSGIAVTAVGTSGGTWQYSIDGGKTWNGLTAGTKTARLLTADNDSLLRFTPTVGFAGTIAAGLTVRGWDQTSGVNGGIADVSKAGGNTAFSSAAAAVKVVVTANRAPTVAASAVLNMPGVVSVTGNSSTMSVADLLKSGTSGAISDLDAGAKSGIAVTAVGTSGGTWQYSIDGGKTWNGLTAGTKTARLLTADNDSLLRFTPTVGFAGTIAAGLTVRGWDQNSGVNGGVADLSKAGGNTAFSSAAAAVKVVVIANHAPTFVPANVTNSTATPGISDTDVAAPLNGVVKVSQVIASSGFGISDVDAGAKRGIAVTAVDAARGEWQYSVDRGGAWQNLRGADGSALLLADDDNTFIRFVPTAGTATASLTFRAWDQTVGTSGGTADASQVGGSTAFSATNLTARFAGTASVDTFYKFDGQSTLSYLKNGQWETVSNAIRTFAITADKAVYYLDEAGRLYEDIGNGSSQISGNHTVLEMVVGDGGRTIYFYDTYGGLFSIDRDTGVNLVVAENVKITGLAAVANGDVWCTDTAGTLRKHISGTAVGEWTMPWSPNHGTVVQLISGDGGRAIYFYDTYGGLFAIDGSGFNLVVAESVKITGLAAVANGDVWCTDTAGTLRKHVSGTAVNEWATPWSPNHGTVVQLISGDGGRAIYFYDTYGGLFAIDGSGFNLVVAESVKITGLAAVANGDVWCTDTAGTLRKHVSGTAVNEWATPWSPNHGTVVQLISGDGGRAIYFYDTYGGLFAIDGSGFNLVVAENVKITGLAAVANGDVWASDLTGRLRKHISGTAVGEWTMPWSPNHGTVVQLISGDGGRAIYFYDTYGGLFAIDGSGFNLVIAENVKITGLAAVANGDVWASDLTGRLRKHISGTAVGEWTMPWSPNHGTVVQLISGDGGRAIYFYDTYGGLFAIDGSGFNLVVAESVKITGLAAVANGDVWCTDTAGTLRKHVSGTAVNEWATPWSPNHGTVVQLISGDGGRAIYFYDTYGGLFAIDGSGFNLVVAENVKITGLAAVANGDVWASDLTGRLRKHISGTAVGEWTMPWSPNHGTVVQLISGDGGRAIYFYDTYGGLFAIDGSGFNLVIAENVKITSLAAVSMDGSGHFVALINGHALYREVTQGQPWQLLDNTTTSFGFDRSGNIWKLDHNGSLSIYNANEGWDILASGDNSSYFSQRNPIVAVNDAGSALARGLFGSRSLILSGPTGAKVFSYATEWYINNVSNKAVDMLRDSGMIAFFDGLLNRFANMSTGTWIGQSITQPTQKLLREYVAFTEGAPFKLISALTDSAVLGQATLKELFTNGAPNAVFWSLYQGKLNRGERLDPSLYQMMRPEFAEQVRVLENLGQLWRTKSGLFLTDAATGVSRTIRPSDDGPRPPITAVAQQGDGNWHVEFTDSLHPEMIQDINFTSEEEAHAAADSWPKNANNGYAYYTVRRIYFSPKK